MWVASRFTTITIIQKPAQIPIIYAGYLDIVRNKLVALSSGGPPPGLLTTETSTGEGSPTINLNPRYEENAVHMYLASVHLSPLTLASFCPGYRSLLSRELQQHLSVSVLRYASNPIFIEVSA